MNAELRMFVRRLLDPLVRRVALLISRGVVQQVTDTTKLQNVQVALVADELADQVEHCQPYGFTAVPLPGAEALFLSVGGVRSAGVVPVVFDRSLRPTGLNPGDVALYDQHGVRVYLDATGDVVNLGAKAAAGFVALAQNTESRLAAIEALINAGIPGTVSGATCLTTPPVPLLNTPAKPVAATKVKAT